MITYYLQFDCPRCDEEIYYGPCGSLLEHDGLPVIPADDGAQTLVRCGECGASVYTGDLDVYAEGGSDDEDPDDEQGFPGGVA